MARWLIVIGLICVGAGVAALLLERAGIRLGRLPGDLVIRGRNGAFYFPIVTCLLLSVLLSLLGWFFRR